MHGGDGKDLLECVYERLAKAATPDDVIALSAGFDLKAIIAAS